MKAKVLSVAFIVLAFVLTDFTHAQDEYGVQITNTGISKWFTDWSPDGKWITYAEFVGNDKYYDVWIVPAEGGAPVNLTANIENFSLHLPGFKPNSIEITFTGGDPYVIYTINIETLQHSVIRERAGKAFWSHNGRYLVFVDQYLRILDTNDGTVGKLVTEYQFSISCFTPDDRYVISTRKTNNKLYKIPVEGGTKEQITFNEGMHWYPKCSPDGKWVVYTVWPKVYWVDASLYATNLETGETFRIFP